MEGIDRDLCLRRLPSPATVMPFHEDISEDLLATEARFVLIYRKAAQALGATLQGGGNVQDGLAHWQDAAGPMLALARQSRRAALIVGEETLLRGDAATLLPLVQLLEGADLPPPLPADETAEEAILALLAEQAVAAAPEILALDLELEARALPGPTTEPSLARIDRMLTDYRGARDEKTLATRQVAELSAELEDSRSNLLQVRRQAEEDHASLNEEAQALRRALEQVQTSVEETKADRDSRLAVALKERETLERDRDQTLALAGQQVRELMEQAEKDHHDLQQARQQVDALLRDLGTQNEQAESQQATLLQSLKKAEQHLAERDRELIEAQQALQQGLGGAEERADMLSSACDLMRSQIVEMQAELGSQADRATTMAKTLADREDQVDRQIKALDSATLRSAALARQLRDQAQEHQLRQDEMLRQIHAAQSEVETARNRATLSEERIGELSAEAAALIAQRAHQNARAENLSRELEAARQHWDHILKQAEQREQSLRTGLEDLTAAYSRLMESRSWKITEPLRAANKLLQRMNRTR